MPFRPPIATPIDTTELCSYGCGQTARYRFAKGKLCCDVTHNKCPKKRQTFSERTDHKETAAKSLATRIRLGITKSSQIKGSATRRANGFYEKVSIESKKRWATKPWNNNLHCPILPYKDTELHYQGSFERDFLEELELDNGLEWLLANVTRGPNIWYIDPIDQTERLYISDFLIGQTVYEVKSGWTWNKHGKDQLLEVKNRAKLDACVFQGYSVVLVLNGEKHEYVNGKSIVDRKTSPKDDI